MASVKDLYEFIQKAENDRSYAQNTARGRRAALQLYEKYLNDDEKTSVEVFWQRLDRIAQVVDTKSKSFKSKTLVDYKKRVRRLIEDYRRYGQSASAMAAWHGNGSTVASKPTAKTKKATNPTEHIEVPNLAPASIFRDQSNDLHDLNVQLRPNLRITLPLPYDLTKREAVRLKLLIDSMILEVGDEGQG